MLKFYYKKTMLNKDAIAIGIYNKAIIPAKTYVIISI